MVRQTPHPVKKKDSVLLDDHAGAVSDVLFFSIGEGAIVIDSRGIITRINQPGLDILGYSAEELVGSWYPDTIIAEEEDGTRIPNIERPITEMFLSGKTIYKKLYYLRKDGSRVPVALTVSPIMLHDKPIGAIQLFRDITEELRLEHAKDEFISIASHQLRTPATVVKQYLGMILEGYVDSVDAQLELLRTAYVHNNNQLDIINDLLRVAQIEANSLAANFHQTDVCKLMSDIVVSQQPEFEKREIVLRLKLPEIPVKVYMDPLHMQMVAENLINNANKYSMPATTVTVIVDCLPREVTVSVRDQGVGIDKKDIPRLFNKFSRLENNGTAASGTGLGLYWAKKLVELYGGTIIVNSRPGKGSTFTVKLPKEAKT
jgi:two-component system phosphate regulon sensor histidine kinase PhoR